MFDSPPRASVPDVRLLGAAVLALSSVACPSHELAPLSPCTQSVGRGSIEDVGTNQVDLLFVIDDSSSMAEEQTTLSEELPRLVEVLTSGRLSPDSKVSFRPVDLHVGVISTDMGGLPDVKYCGASDDGLLLLERGSVATEALPPYLSVAPGTLPADVAARVKAAVELGIEGCGIEQPLEATLKALSPRAGATAFATGYGHGTDENVGFLRDDSLLAVIVVSDEDDCSAPSIAFVNERPNESNLACALRGELYPVERYVAGLRALRPGREDHVVFAAITGVPKDLVADPANLDAAAILDDPRMAYVSDGAVHEPKLKTSCEQVGVGSATPPRRIVELAQAFGDNGVVQSICNDDYRGALEVVLSRIAALLGAACPPRALVRDARGAVACKVVEVPPPGLDCRTLPGRSEATLVGDVSGCVVNQVTAPDGVVGAGAGFYYDAEDEERRCAGTGSIRFTVGAEPHPGSRVDLECISTVAPTEDDPRNEAAVGLACADDATCEGRVDVARAAELTLFCDESRHCSRACADDATCSAPEVCDLGAERPRCVNPTCLP